MVVLRPATRPRSRSGGSSKIFLRYLMPKSIYWVRGQARLAARIALDMLCEACARARQQTTDSLHDARAG